MLQHPDHPLFCSPESSFFPHSIYKVSRDVSTGISNGASTQEAACLANKLNTGAYLHAEFFSDPHLRTVQHWEHHTSKGIEAVTLLEPSSRYVPDRHLMVIAGRPEELKQKYREYPVLSRQIYTFSDVTQSLYWGALLGFLEHQHSAIVASNSQDQQRAMIGEHSMLVRTNDHYRVPRSISLPHGHGVVLNMVDTTPFTEEASERLQHVYEEAALLRAIFSNPAYQDIITSHFSRIQVASRTTTGETLVIRRRLTALPAGYSLLVPRGLSAEKYAQVMNIHYQCYTEFMFDLFSKIHSLEPLVTDMIKIPQPSFRLAGFIANESHLELCIVPSLTSHGGVFEAMGILLDRDAEHPERVPQPDRIADLRKIVADLQPYLTTALLGVL